MVFVNYYANAAAALIFEAADHAAVAVNLYIATGANNVSRKQNREIHQRTHGNVAIHREEHTVGRDIVRLRCASPALRPYGHGQVQGKPRSTLHFGIVLDRSLLLLRVDRKLLLC